MSSTEAVTTARTKTSLQEPRPPAQSLASMEAGPAPELPVCCGTGVGPRGTVASARTPKPDESVIQPNPGRGKAEEGTGRPERRAREARSAERGAVQRAPDRGGGAQRSPHR